MRRRWPCLAALALAACSPDPQPPARDAAAQPHAFAPAIAAPDFAAHVRTLASDAFEGRGPGSNGERATTAYLAAELARIGLEPGNGDSWFQPVPTIEATADPGTELRVAIGDTTQLLAHGTDVVVGTRQARTKVVLERSELVFVGYGVTAPEAGWDDYAGVDVRGKTVVVLINDPGFLRKDPALFRGAAMTYYGRWTYKFEQAARHGAAAALIVHDTGPAAYDWDVVRNSWSGAQFDLPPSQDPEPRLQLEGWISGPAASALFAAAGRDLEADKLAADARGFRAFALGATLDATLRSTIRQKQSDNVIGVLRGTTHAHEAVVFVAHWDHLGRRADEPGDAIYNGAIDNAAGVAGVLELAEAYASSDVRPARTLVFALVTLEESGLLGSRWYVNHPIVPLADTVAAINLDALPVRGRARDMDVIGLGQSQLDDALAQALAAQGRAIAPESAAASEKGYYYRSDHFSFARKGVPALYARGGSDLHLGGIEAGRRASEAYTNQRYHRPADEFDPAWDLAGVIEDLQAMHEVGRRLASAELTPQWSGHSEFRAAREASRSSRQLPVAGHQGVPTDR